MTVVEDNRKRLAAPVAGLEESVSVLVAAASEAGRPVPTTSVMLAHVVSCPSGEIEENERACANSTGWSRCPSVSARSPLSGHLDGWSTCWRSAPSGSAWPR
ncbi:MAG: hypothetical protein ACLP7F_13450 [Acidimicrobiales bacterium]